MRVQLFFILILFILRFLKLKTKPPLTSNAIQVNLTRKKMLVLTVTTTAACRFDKLYAQSYTQRERGRDRE